MKPTKEHIAHRAAHFETVCRHASAPITQQLIAIFGFLAASDRHPSAKDIFAGLKKNNPTLSLATVYKNIDKLVALGLVRKLELPDRTARFDANLDAHHHIIDIDTDEIHDLATDAATTPKLPPHLGFLRLEAVSVNYYVRSK